MSIKQCTSPDQNQSPVLLEPSWESEKQSLQIGTLVLRIKNDPTQKERKDDALSWWKAPGALPESEGPCPEAGVRPRPAQAAWGVQPYVALV